MTDKSEQWPPARGVPGKARFKKARALQWGESPFDDLDRGELLRLVQAYHAAAVSANSVLALCRHGQECSPFWGSDGSGGRAKARLEWLIAQCGDGGMNEASERIYRSFFCSAYGLLFPTLKGEFEDWGIDKKGMMAAPNPGREQGYRPIRWADLLPVPEPAIVDTHPKGGDTERGSVHG
jgi:hypothetical protein